MTTAPESDDPQEPGPARDQQAAQAALDSVDRGRLLPGEAADVLLANENPDTTHREDAEVWISVYSELLDFKRFMIDGQTARAAAMTTDIAREEVEVTDLRVARSEAERFMRRLAFWRGRLEALHALEAARPA